VAEVHNDWRWTIIATSASVSVPTGSAVQLDNLPGLVQQQTLTIRNTDSTNPVYLGGPNVSSSTGFPLPAGQQFTLTREPIYARATGAAVTVAVIAPGTIA
jgi:hypothetical protein